MTTNIQHALRALDPDNDGHWTDDGLPRVDAVAVLAGEKVTRKQITNTDPEFTRERAELDRNDAALVPDDEDDAMPPPEDPVARATVEPVPAADYSGESLEDDIDDVLNQPVPQVFGDPTLTQKALIALEEKLLANQKRKAAVELEARQLNEKIRLCTRQMTQHQRNGRIPQEKPIQDYLRRQKENREERARRAAIFIEAGTTAADVAKQLQGGSDLDRAMARKRARGTQRPQPRALGA